MGANKFSHTHIRLTMCGLKKLASGVFLESWKVLAERRWQKRTKNNKSPGYPGWLNEFEKFTCKIAFASPRGQWLNGLKLLKAWQCTSTNLDETDAVVSVMCFLHQPIIWPMHQAHGQAHMGLGKWVNDHYVAHLNYRSRKLHRNSDSENSSSGFRDLCSAKPGPHLHQIWQFFGSWAAKAHMGQMGKWPWCCTNTDQDNSIELPTKETIFADDGQPVMDTMGKLIEIYHLLCKVQFPYYKVTMTLNTYRTTDLKCNLKCLHHSHSYRDRTSARSSMKKILQLMREQTETIISMAQYKTAVTPVC